MSRSHKKQPISKMTSRYGKKIANRAARRNCELPSGKSNTYKKLFESWDVADDRFFYSCSDFLEGCSDELASREARLRKWKKYYYRK